VVGGRWKRLIEGDDTMSRLRDLALRLLRDDAGQDLIEYALLATFVALVAIAGATLLGTALNGWFTSISSSVSSASRAGS